MPMNNPSAVSGAGDRGIFVDSTTLQTAYPAAGSAGWTASVGASAPYALYYSNGSAWAATGGSGSPGGSTTQVQFNDAGAFAGASGMAWDKVNNVLTVAAGTHTTSQPQSITETWNAGGVQFTAWSLNVTDNGSASLSYLATWGVGGSYRFKVDKSGNIQCTGSVTASGNLLANGVVQISGGVNLTSDTNPIQLGVSVDVILGRAAAASLRMGAANAASPVAQTLTTQAPRGGTDSNTAGAALRISAGPSTGTATPNIVILQSTVVAASGTTAQTQIDTFSVQNGSTRRRLVTVATLPASPTAGDECNVSDALSPTFLGTLTGGGAVLCGARYNGSTWVAF